MMIQKSNPGIHHALPYVRTCHPTRIPVREFAVDRQEIVIKAKAVAYVVVLLLVVLLTLCATYCFLLMLVQPPWAWLRIVCAVVGTVLVALNFAVILLLNRFIPSKVVFVRFGVPLFWLGWAIPLFSVILAVSLAVAVLCGVEIEVDSSSHHGWDWD